MGTCSFGLRSRHEVAWDRLGESLLRKTAPNGPDWPGITQIQEESWKEPLTKISELREVRGRCKTHDKGSTRGGPAWFKKKTAFTLRKNPDAA